MGTQMPKTVCLESKSGRVNHPSTMKVGDKFGYSVSLSSNGETVAVGAKETKKDKVYSDDVLLNSGRVRVYTLNESRLNWIILGDDIDGEGTSVSLSENGRTVAIGATGNYGDTYLGTPISGYVKVYKW